MANFDKALKRLWSVEFSNVPERMLHLVKGDNGGMTYKGIARKYHSSWDGWQIIDAVVSKTDTLGQAALALLNNVGLQRRVNVFYQVDFWNFIQGDHITYQATAEEMFLSCVNIGIKRCVRMAQETSGAKVDGLFGVNTLAKINAMSPDMFCGKYTKLEEEYYTNLVIENPKLKKFEAGWIARSHVVDGDNALKIA